MSDAHTALLRSIARDYDAGQPPELRDAGCRAWASATFTGARHWLLLGFAGEDAAGDARDFAGWADEYEFALPGHLIADIRSGEPEITGALATMRLEVLTIETC